MSQTQARALLLAGLPPLPAAVAAGLLEETGRWPLLLRLVNKILTDQARLQPDITAAAEDLLGRLRRGGALQLDELTGAAEQQLDVSDPDQRNKTVRATIQASTSLLSPDERERFAELAVFAEDETIPVTLVTALWQATGGLDQMASAGAVRPAGRPGPGHAELPAAVAPSPCTTSSATSCAQNSATPGWHSCIEVLLDAVAAGMPRAAAAAPGHGKVTAWWELPEPARYLREHLIEHLLAAGRAAEAEELAADLRWAGARLELSGPAGPYADLARIGTPRAQRLARVLGQAAHLLAPADPPHSLIDILYSRVSHDPDWGAQAQALAASRKLPALINKWPLPDLPDPALRRTLTGHAGWVTAVAIAPDGTWLATGGGDGTVRIWDPATGQQRATLTGHTGCGDGGGDRPGRHLARHRRRRRDGADLGPGHRPAARHPHRPHRLGDRGGDRPGRHLARHRRRRRDGADLGPGHRPAARRPHRPHRRGDGGGDRPGRHLARHRRRRRDGADLGPGHRPAARRPHRPHRLGDGGGDRPGRHLARHRRRRRDGADLGPGHRPAARRPHRPHRRGDRGGDRPGRHLARHRRRRRDGADLGRRPPASSAPPSPATPAR